MRAPRVAFAVMTSLLPIAACGNSDATPQPTAPTAVAYPPGYPPPAQGQPPPPGYAPASAPPGYPTAAPQYAPAPYPPPAATYPAAPVATYTAAPVATYAPPAPAAPPPPAPGATTTMSTPGLLALPCQSDAICGLHHCNMQYAKCAFPCQTAVDCVSNNCVMGVCLPGGGP
jgi:hypothetical protein